MAVRLCSHRARTAERVVLVAVPRGRVGRADRRRLRIRTPRPRPAHDRPWETPACDHRELASQDGAAGSQGVRTPGDPILSSAGRGSDRLRGTWQRATAVDLDLLAQPSAVRLGKPGVATLRVRARADCDGHTFRRTRSWLVG